MRNSRQGMFPLAHVSLDGLLARHVSDTIAGMAESFSAKLANIVLPDAGGGEFRLGSLWESTPAVVVFLRHYG